MKKMISNLAVVDERAKIGPRVCVWHFAQIREGVEVGDNTIIGKGAYIGKGVKIGKNCKIGNNAQIFEGTVIQDGVFVGPCVCFTNDKYPAAVNVEGKLKSGADWTLSKTLVAHGVSIGANSTILCGITLGERCFVGAGSVVTKDVKHNSIVVGNPAKAKRGLNDAR